MSKKFNFVIWGTGHYADVVHDYLELLKHSFLQFDYSIDAFIDKNPDKQNTLFKGIPVFSPDYVFSIDSNTTIIIAIFNCGEVENFLYTHGIDNYLTSFEVVFDEKLAIDIFLEENITPKCTDNLFVKRINERVKIKKGIKTSYSLQLLSAMVGEFKRELKMARKYADTFSFSNDQRNGKVIGIYYRRLYNGGIERVISKQIPLFVSMGYHIILFTHVISDLDYSIPSEVERCAIPFEELSPYLWLEKMHDELIARNVDILINHVHAEYISYYLGLCTKELGIRYIIESHTCNACIELRNPLFFYDVYSTADRLVVLSNADQDYWLNKHISAKYIPNPIELPDTIYSHDYDSNVILWVGRIDEDEKRISETIPVLNELKKIYSDFLFKIVGRADDVFVYEKYLEAIHINGLEDNVVFCGYCEDVSEYYINAAVLICTSPYEGFPMAIAESRGYGLPAVVYELKGVELFRDGKGYISVSQGDYISMAKNIYNVLKDKNLREKLSVEARQSIKSFSEIDTLCLWKEVFTN